MATSPRPIVYRQYTGESDLPHIMSLVQHELSEPYVIYTYRYFLRQWPHLSFLAYPDEHSDPVGVIVCKQSMHREARNRGYIAMLSVHRDWRKRGIASTLVRRSLAVMEHHGVEEVVLETEFDNSAALSLYESLGFIREKRLFRFYLNGKDAFRLVLVVPPSSDGQKDDVEVSPITAKPLFLAPPRMIAIPPLPYDTDEASAR
ncbi:acyl-CoA N-acyltransferase [Fomitopsis betulina]|nr:acyl-CoA N-acyltransferase [Fomitopsis betulina]